MILAADEIPSEPGGVGARAIPLARGMVRKKWWSILWRLRELALGEMARCEAGGQSVQGLAEARVTGARSLPAVLRAAWTARAAVPTRNS
jgi:hypothetical protein